MLELLTANLNGTVRREVLDGREYLVVPASLIVPGVLNGSKGSLYYPLEEITKNHDAWNGMPIVVNHPLDAGGKACSARSPAIIRKYGVGTVFNATINGKLDAETWFDVIKSRKLIPTTFNALEQGKPVELSTGLFTDNEPVENGETPDGKKYEAIARNYRPDHLAILPDKVGACSNKDGCGINVNAEPTDKQLGKYLDFDEDHQPPANNQLSHSDLRDQISKLIRQRYGMSSDIVDVFDKCVVYTNYQDGPSSKYYEVYYTTDLRTGKVSLSDDGAKEVVRETRYKAITANRKRKKLLWYELIGNVECGAECACEKCKTETVVAVTEPGKSIQNKETDMGQLTKEQKAELIDRLVDNEGIEEEGPWDEKDKPALNALPDAKLEALDRQRELVVNAHASKETMDDDLTDDPDEDDEDDEDYEEPPPKKKGKKPPFVKNEERKPARRKTTQEWLADAPEEIQSAVNNALEFEKQQKDGLIARIVKNERNQFTKQYLQSQTLPFLRGLAALAVNVSEQEAVNNQQNMLIPNPNYLGVPGITQNLGEDFSKEDLDMQPEPMDWSQAAAGK